MPRRKLPKTGLQFLILICRQAAPPTPSIPVFRTTLPARKVGPGPRWSSTDELQRPRTADAAERKRASWTGPSGGPSEAVRSSLRCVGRNHVSAFYQRSGSHTGENLIRQDSQLIPSEKDCAARLDVFRRLLLRLYDLSDAVDQEAKFL